MANELYGSHLKTIMQVIRYIVDLQNDEVWEGKGSTFNTLWEGLGTNLIPFHNASFWDQQHTLLGEKKKKKMHDQGLILLQFIYLFLVILET